MRRLTASKREAILQAAAEVFARRGFHRALVEEMAKRAGVGKGTVYRYFRNKEDLFFSIVDEGAKGLVSRMSKAAASAEDPQQVLCRLIEAMADYIHYNRPLFKLFREIDMKEKRKHLKDIKRYNAKIFHLTEKVIRRGIEAKAFRRGNAKLWARMLAIMASNAYMDCPASKRDRLTQEVLDLMLNGIAGKETKGE